MEEKRPPTRPAVGPVFAAEKGKTATVRTHPCSQHPFNVYTARKEDLPASFRATGAR